MTAAPTDAELVARSLAGDQQAFGDLVERHQHRVCGHLRRLIGPRDAEDLAQETFVRAWQNLHRYDAAYRFLSWLLVMGSRLAMNHLRDQHPHRLPSLDACGDIAISSVGEPSDTTTQRDEHAWMCAQLERLLDQLDDKARLLYELRYRQELSIDELADLLGASPGAIKVRLHRLREALAARLRELTPSSDTVEAP